MREAMNAAALKGRAEQMVRRELMRCEAALGPAAWARHGEWVTALVVTSAKEWLVASARKGGNVSEYLKDADFDALADVNEWARLAKDLRVARQEFYADHPPARAQVMLAQASDIVAEPIVWLWPAALLSTSPHCTRSARICSGRTPNALKVRAIGSRGGRHA